MTSSYSYKYTSTGRYKMRYYINQEIYKMGKSSSEFQRIRAENIDNVVENNLKQFFENITEKLNSSNNQNLISQYLKTLKIILVEPTESISKIILFPDHTELEVVIKTHEDDSGDAFFNFLQALKPDSHSPQYAKRSLRQRYLSPKIIEQIVSNKDSSTIGVDQLINFNHWDWQVQGGALLV